MKTCLLLGPVCALTFISGSLRAQQAPVASPSPSPAAAKIEGQVFHDGSGGSLELGCEGRALLAQGHRFYVACGSAGVVIVGRGVDGSLAHTGQLATQGEAVALFERAGKVWVETLHVSAEPLASSALASPLAVPPPATEPAALAPAPAALGSAAEAPVGEVLELRPDGFIISLGRAHDLKVGDHIEVFIMKSEAVLGETIAIAETLAVGEVLAASEQKSRVQLGMNEHVSVGAKARPTKRRATANLAGPPRAAPLTRLEVGINPFLPVGDLGIGLVGHGRVTYHFDRPWMIGAALTPFGVSIGHGDNAGLFGGFAFGAFDHRVFALGVSLGVTSTDVVGSGELERRFALGTLVRFGAVDGLHVGVHTQFTLEEEEAGAGAREFAFANIAGRLQLPFARGVWGLMHHEFDAMHYNGALGFKFMVRGEGGKGSLFVTPEIGGAVTFEGPNRAGPSVGLELERRF